MDRKAKGKAKAARPARTREAYYTRSRKEPEITNTGNEQSTTARADESSHEPASAQDAALGEVSSPTRSDARSNDVDTEHEGWNKSWVTWVLPVVDKRRAMKRILATYQELPAEEKMELGEINPAWGQFNGNVRFPGTSIVEVSDSDSDTSSNPSDQDETVLAEQQPFVPQDPQWDTLRKSILRNLKYLVIFILLLFPVNMMWKWYGGLTTWSPYPSQQFAMAPNQAVIPVLNLLYEAKYSCSQQAGFFSLDRCSAPTEQQCKILVHGQESICNQLQKLPDDIVARYFALILATGIHHDEYEKVYNRVLPNKEALKSEVEWTEVVKEGVRWRSSKWLAFNRRAKDNIASLSSSLAEAQLDLKILTDQGAALQAKICGNAEEPLEDERSLASLLARHRQIASWAPLLSEVSDDVQSVGKWCDDLVKKAQLFDESIARGEIRPDFLEWVKELETMNQGARMAARGSTIIVGWNEIPEAVEVLERMGYRQIMEEQGVWK